MMKKKHRADKYITRFTWKTKPSLSLLMSWLSPTVHTLTISTKGIKFDSQLVPWGNFFGFHGSMAHHENTIVLKVKDVNHKYKSVGMSQRVQIDVPDTEDVEKVKNAIIDASDQYCSDRDLTGYHFKK